MTDYWKSIPKYYCKFCNIWIVDNKSSRDFHERGLKHQSNVKRKIHEAQRETGKAEREAREYEAQMRKIENAALSSFQGDIARDSKYAKELSQMSTSTNALKNSSSNESIIRQTKVWVEDDNKESNKLLQGRSDALKTISKVLEKRSKWFEAITTEGNTYYYNKETLETRRDPPKGGFLSLTEQATLTISSTSIENDRQTEHETHQKFHQIYNPWQEVVNEGETDIVDLELPGQDDNNVIHDISSAHADFKNDLNNDKEAETKLKPDGIIKEKTVENCKRKITSSKDNVTFKKRSNLTKRNIRIKDDCNE